MICSDCLCAALIITVRQWRSISMHLLHLHHRAVRVQQSFDSEIRSALSYQGKFAYSFRSLTNVTGTRVNATVKQVVIIPRPTRVHEKLPARRRCRLAGDPPTLLSIYMRPVQVNCEKREESRWQRTAFRKDFFFSSFIFSF